MIDALSIEAEQKQLVKLLSLQETLRDVREVAVKEGLPLTTVVPSLSLSQMRYCLGLPNEQEKIYVADATPGAVAKRVLRCKPALDKLRMVVNPRFRDTVAAACENLYADVVSNEKGVMIIIVSQVSMQII